MRTVRASFLSLIVAGVALVGCSSFDQGRLGQMKAGRAVCFEEIGDREGPLAPEGMCDLVINLSIKIPKEDAYLIKSRPKRSELSSYPIVVNIDGQGCEWAASCGLDDQGYYVGGMRNPERGEGFKCLLNKRIRLKPGSHVIYIGSLEDRHDEQIKVDLAEGTSNRLELRPVYWRTRTGGRYFLHGLSHFEVSLNGKQIH